MNSKYEERVAVLLFQLVVDPPLSLCSNTGFTGEDLALLKKNALAVLDKIHSRGVFHGDIAPRNVLCRLEDMKITFLDFGMSIFADVNYWQELKECARLPERKRLIRQSKNDGIAMLWETLGTVGVKDERPKPVLEEILS